MSQIGDIGGPSIGTLNNVTVHISGYNNTPVLKASTSTSGFSITKPTLENRQIENMNLDYYVSAKNKVTTIKGEKGSYTYTMPGNKYTVETHFGQQYVVCKTKADLNDYLTYIKSKGIFQEANWGAWHSNCQNIAYMHAYGLYQNKRGYSTKNVDNGNCGGSFRTFISGDLDKIYQVIYYEITNGKPVVIQVNADSAGKDRHFVTIVGFSAGVTGPGDLDQSKLLIIDSCDGQLERMGFDGRFLTTGKQVGKGKDYKGYYIRYIDTKSTITGDTGIPNVTMSKD